MLGQDFGSSSSSYRDVIGDLDPSIWLEMNKFNVPHGDDTIGSNTIVNRGNATLDHTCGAHEGDTGFTHGGMVLNAVKFDGAGDVMKITNSFQSTNKSFCTAIVFQKGDTATDVLLGHKPDLSDGFYLKVAGSLGRVDMNMGASFDVNKAFSLSSSFLRGTNKLLIVNRDVGGEVFIHDHEQQLASNVSNAQVLAMPYISWGFIGGTDSDLNGLVGEIIQFDRFLQSGEISIIQQEMALKWSIT